MGRTSMHSICVTPRSTNARPLVFAPQLDPNSNLQVLVASLSMLACVSVAKDRFGTRALTPACALRFPSCIISAE